MPTEAVSRSQRFPETTTESLLEGLKDLIKRHKGASHAFGQLRSLRLGMVPEAAPYPSIAINPVNLQFGQNYSSNVYEARYLINFEIHVLQDRADSASKAADLMYEDLQTFLDDHYDVDGRCSRIDYNDVQKDDALQLPSRHFMQAIMVPATFTSKNTRPGHKSFYRHENDPSQPTLPKFVFSIIKEELINSSPRAKINFFHGAAYPPSPVYPAVTITEVTKERDRGISGIDQDARVFAATVLTAITPHEDSIVQNVRLVDYLIRIIFENRNWGGLAVNSQPTGAVFAVDATNEHQFLYTSQVEFVVWSRRKLPAY